MGLKSVLGKIVTAPVKGVKALGRNVKRAAIGSVVLSVLVVADQAFGLDLSGDLLRMIADVITTFLADAASAGA